MRWRTKFYLQSLRTRITSLYTVLTEPMARTHNCSASLMALKEQQKPLSVRLTSNIFMQSSCSPCHMQFSKMSEHLCFTLGERESLTMSMTNLTLLKASDSLLVSIPQNYPSRGKLQPSFLCTKQVNTHSPSNAKSDQSHNQLLVGTLNGFTTNSHYSASRTQQSPKYYGVIRGR